MQIIVRKGVITIRSKLKEMRDAKGISQVELAEKSGVSRNTIIKIENNSEVCITTETMKKLAYALDVKPSDIFCFE